MVRHAPGAAVVAVVPAGDDSSIRLLALDPAYRGRGLGHELLKAAEDDLAGAPVVTVGADAPYFLFPGVPVRETSLCCLLERHHYAREETNYNVDIRLDDLPPDRAGGRAGSRRASEFEAWMSRHWPNWQAEALRAFDLGTLLVARHDGDITGFCAYDVNGPAPWDPSPRAPTSSAGEWGCRC